ncbi:hypothetical protein LC613_06855 [Nostoc sphaeroides CHAB 2801]|uniref:hypothetical protein n=1 Tax=Nostoc sphaeroides TaxID=446679 RepID=UPI0011C0C9FC|nr:hypothetical protein [Nostoc sphaeroides]MCC5627871.1 hypothetical protein [Nostoc sphaeroides CHAB 2801]
MTLDDSLAAGAIALGFSLWERLAPREKTRVRYRRRSFSNFKTEVLWWQGDERVCATIGQPRSLSCNV